MRKNNKGLSTVVTTLIIILLVLVAVGIIWGVVNNLLNKSTDTIASSAECLDLDLRATQVTEAPAGTYDVTLKRSSAGTDEDIFAKIVFFNDGGNSVVEDFSTGLAPLESQTLSIVTNPNFVSATSVQVTAYYLDEAGSEALCPITTELEF